MATSTLEWAAAVSRYGATRPSTLLGFIELVLPKMYKSIPLIYNLVLPMLCSHPENVELDKVKVVHYCASLKTKVIRCEESKAYRLYDPISQRIIISKDVVFEEDMNGIGIRSMKKTLCAIWNKGIMRCYETGERLSEEDNEAQLAMFAAANLIQLEDTMKSEK
ncbi:hypothetical protein JRO89_XS05G0082600 [Xanthoceras sorbifolium]|uniref:Retroviral polymerase SH3-like domain-containing protein n=1 Tax=Xanthoceras sorbifolium TaxID=99658 RepID=A0ABQ8I121_9ROSI|nr:hypothetical protein JRO89_XS05G0082600 [Xanthoceras sorbifolium]